MTSRRACYKGTAPEKELQNKSLALLYRLVTFVFILCYYYYFLKLNKTKNNRKTIYTYIELRFHCGYQILRPT